MKKNIILYAISLFAVFTVQADIIVTPRVSNTLRFNADDIWNINIQYIGSGSPQVIIEATLNSSQGVVLTAKSNSTSLKVGLNSFTSISLGTQQLKYAHRNMEEVVTVLGSLPSGSYSICYRVKCIEPNCNGAGQNAVSGESNDCSDLTVEPSTPLLLSFPEDDATLSINNKRPTFSWIPPSPISQISGFNYQYTLVEARENQQCEDAIQRNRPLYRQQGLGNNVLPYPSDLSSLDTGKKYCWQVHGLADKLPIAQSEVWEFKLKAEKKDTLQLTYHKLSTNHVKTFDIPKKFGVIHKERKRTNVLEYKILDLETNIAVKDGELDVVYGENKIDFDLTKLYKAQPDKLFQLQIFNKDKMISQMKFKFQ